MATNFAMVQVIYRKNHFVAQDPSLNWAEINCERISAFTPRQCWLIREKYTDGRILYTITYTEDTQANTLKGYWIEQDGEGMMIDVAAVDGVPVSLTNYCRSCCDASPIPTISTEYDWNDLTDFNITTPTPTNYCIFRPLAIGSLKDLQKVQLDYVGNIDGILLKTVSTSPSGVYYQGTAYQAPSVIGDDVVTSGACS